MEKRHHEIDFVMYAKNIGAIAGAIISAAVIIPYIYGFVGIASVKQVNALECKVDKEYVKTEIFDLKIKPLVDGQARLEKQNDQILQILSRRPR